MTDNYDQLKNIISATTLLKEGPIIVAIDGGSGTGKTSLAERLAADLDCNVFHMDHFHLRPDQRTPQRLNRPGGNFDKERYFADVLIPLRYGRAVSYRPWNCRTLSYDEPISLPLKKLNIIEGAYSQHPDFKDFYNFTVFLTSPLEDRLARLREREGDAYDDFVSKWIPLEDRFFITYSIQKHADMVLEM